MSDDPHPYYRRECAVKVEILHGPRKGEMEHCPGRVVCSFVDKEKHLTLCERCTRNVRRGDFGARLRDLLNEQVPDRAPALRTP